MFESAFMLFESMFVLSISLRFECSPFPQKGIFTCAVIDVEFQSEFFTYCDQC